MIEDTEDDIGESAPVSSAQSEDEAGPPSGLPSVDDEEPEAAMDESDTSTVTEDDTAPAAEFEDDEGLVRVVQTQVSVVQAEAVPVDDEVLIETTSAVATEVHQVPDDDATSSSPINDEEGAEDTTLALDSAADADASDLFFVDDTGADATMSYDRPLYDTTASTAPIGSAAPPTDDVEDIVFRPQLIADPVASLPSASTSRPQVSTDFELSSVYIDPRIGMSRKEKKAAKRAKRASRKSRKRQEARMRADSDVDWGSDMEAAGVVGVEVDELGERFASAGLDDEDQQLEEDVDSELDYEAMARFSRGIGFGQGTGGELGVDVETDSDEYEELPAKGKAPIRVSELRFETVVLTDHAQDPFRAASSNINSSDEEDDSDGDEADDSNVNSFGALQEAYDQQEESPDEDSYFQGNNTWNTEDEETWFAESMEDALDGGVMAASRKERKAVFRAVQSGTFDADLPIAPAKKDKKGSHIPPELRNMWQRDREKKAEKKREREALRMALTMAGRKATKLGSKSAAASIAHLIPGSASEVADMFDVSDDDWSGIPTRGGRVALLPLTLRQINTQITTFLLDNGKTTLPLPPMDKETRRKVHMLAELYDLKSKSKGKGNSRFP